MNTTNNFQFLVFFAQYFNILPQNKQILASHTDVIANKFI